MIDIWGEKPKSGETCGCYDGEIYGADEIDAWLEKLKASFDESIANCHYSLEIVAKKLNEDRNKLEAVKTLIKKVETTQDTLGSRWFKNSLHFKALKKILEIEE